MIKDILAHKDLTREERQELHEWIDNVEALQKMHDNLMAMPEARRVMEWEGETEVALFAEDEATGLQMKGRLDKLSSDDAGRYVIPEIKTCADPSDFERTASALGYYIQDAFYRNLVKLTTGEDATFLFIAVGTSEPYAVRVGYLDDEAKRKGEEEMRKLLDFYAWCIAQPELPAHKISEAKRVGLEQFKLRIW